MTTETHGSLSYRARASRGLEAGEISRFLPKAETSEEFAYICTLEARYLQLTGHQWRRPARDTTNPHDVVMQFLRRAHP